MLQALEEAHQLRDSNTRLRQQLEEAQNAAQTTAMLGDERLRSVREAADQRCDEVSSDLTRANKEVRRLEEELSSLKHAHTRELSRVNTRLAEEVEMRASLERRLEAATAAAQSEQDTSLTLSNSLTNTANNLVALQSEVKKVGHVCRCCGRRAALHADSTPAAHTAQECQYGPQDAAAAHGGAERGAAAGAHDGAEAT